MSEVLKHTPGPWKYTESFPFSDSFMIQTIDDSHRNTFIGDIGGGLQSKNEKEFNARLIAAAPEMYEALNNLLGKIQALSIRGINYAIETQDIESIKSAISKAEGKETPL